MWGEMDWGVSAVGAAVQMNLRAHCAGFKVWERAQKDIDRITTIWRDCLAAYGRPYLFGALGMADAMYAPVVTRFLTYDVQLDEVSAAYCQTIMALPAMQEGIAAARQQPDQVDERDVQL